MFLPDIQSKTRQHSDEKTKKRHQAALASSYFQIIGQKIIFGRLLPYFVIIFLSHAASASETVSQINSIAQEYLNRYLSDQIAAEKISRFELTLGKIDPRLNLSPCPESALSVKLTSDPMKTSRNSLKVSCDRSWSLIINARITLFVPALVSTRHLNRGDIVEPGDITTGDIPLRKLRYGYYHNSANLVGLSVKRTISPGQPFSPPRLETPKLISKGDNVVISARSDMLSVKMMGTALTNGKKGQQILVRNNTSERVVKAFVLRKGLVEIPL
ncbi:MAG: flagella basal body P-ring formation protein FlgA [Gammaproteobacteria bacterium]|nr:MAG: flagella basal body P-ring formation protein FlgA [Pseudomonadota bacterium]PIE38006.1 MAG: flagella basal body P-ring formation protein FlgA [Gammaproteobacteria bacterium]